MFVPRKWAKLNDPIRHMEHALRILCHNTIVYSLVGERHDTVGGYFCSSMAGSIVLGRRSL
jgi:hypothetical protein